MNQEKNQEKFKIFLDVTRNLNEIGIIPTLTGSLGLYRIIGDYSICKDIDTLIPNNYLEKDSDKILELMEFLGWKRTDKEKFIFKKGSEEISFMKQNDPEGAIKIKDLKTTEIDRVKFNELSLEDYQKFYEKMLNDKERFKNKGKQDKEKLEQIKKHLEENAVSKEQEYLEGWKRCQADFENYKKRQGELQIENIKYANLALIMEILPVLDNFHASTDHVPEDQKDNAWVVGIMHIQKQLEKVLTDNGVTEIETKVGDDFNPNIHEAVHPVKSAEGGPAKREFDRVNKIILKGYKMQDKVIRAARVIVE
jgi:molecular chaperone GrpE